MKGRLYYYSRRYVQAGPDGGGGVRIASSTRYPLEGLPPGPERVEKDSETGELAAMLANVDPSKWIRAMEIAQSIQAEEAAIAAAHEAGKQVKAPERAAAPAVPEEPYLQDEAE